MNENKLVKGVAWLYFEKVGVLIVRVLISIVLARLLDPDHYGSIALVTVFITIIDAIVAGGFGKALVQKSNSDDLDFNTICWFSLFVCVILYVGLFFFAPAVADFYSNDELDLVIKIMGISVFFTSFNSIQQAFIQKRMEFRKFFWSTIGGTIMSGVVGIVLAVMGYGIWALVGQFMTNVVIDTLVLFCIIEWKPKFQFSFTRLKSLFRFGSFMVGSTIVSTLQDNVRSLVVGKVFTTEDLAYYNQGKKYPEYLMTSIIGSIGMALFPSLSSEPDEVRFKEIVRKSIKISSFVLLPAVIGIIAISDTFVSVFLTDKWLDCVQYMRILACVYLTRPLDTIFQQALLAKGKGGLNFIHELICALISVGLIFVASFALESVIWIALSYILVTIISTILFYIFIRREIKYSFKEMVVDYLPFLLTSIVMGAAVFAISFIPINKIFILIIQLVVGIGGYLLLSKLFKFKELGYSVELVKKIVRRTK